MRMLPNVTLITYDNSDTPEKSLRALRYCASLIRFATVVLVCRAPVNGLNGETMLRVSEHGYEAAMSFEVNYIGDYVQTDFALFVSHDGYILNPDAWSDSWFKYDFIGAPWPLKPSFDHPGCADFPESRVGNTGFCLKSRDFMRASAQLGSEFNPLMHGDVFCCQVARPRMEAMGIRYAPIAVAAGFSWENNIEEFPNGRPDAFGFHGFNGKSVPKLT